MKMIKKYCIDCKKELSKDSNSKARCRKCHFQHLHDNPQSCSNFKHGRAVKKYFNCVDCGVELSSNPYAKRCHICATKHLHKIGMINCKGEKNSNWNGGKPKCIDCGKRTKDYNKKRCWKCYVKWSQIPQNNPNWTGGIAEDGYSFEFTEELKEQIHQRDNYECQNPECNMTEEEHLIVYGKKLPIHHIDYNKQNCSKENLITLCHQCNIRANYNRDYWYAYFIYLMENKK